MKPYYQDNYCTIYHGDCLDIMPHLEPVDLVLTDPPYGIQADEFRKTLPQTKGKSFVSSMINDDGIDHIKKLLLWLNGRDAVIWGANNWPHLLPHKGIWYCWDKRCSAKVDKMLGSPFELAWANKKNGYHIMIRLQHGGVINADKGKRLHPTQKPMRLFSAVIQNYKNAQTILDPFMGSGTTLVAAKQLNRKAIGIEIEEKYCEIAALRLDPIHFVDTHPEHRKKGLFY